MLLSPFEEAVDIESSSSLNTSVLSLHRRMDVERVMDKDNSFRIFGLNQKSDHGLEVVHIAI
jgi:hypothetical protein